MARTWKSSEYLEFTLKEKKSTDHGISSVHMCKVHSSFQELNMVYFNPLSRLNLYSLDQLTQQVALTLLLVTFSA